MLCFLWGYSSVVEHLTADQEVPSSTLGAPSHVGLISHKSDISSVLRWFGLEFTRLAFTIKTDGMSDQRVRGHPELN